MEFMDVLLKRRSTRKFSDEKITKDELALLARLLSPFAPHVAEEVYEALGGDGLVSLAKWPEFDPSKTVDDTVEMPVQINGKVRSVVAVSKNASKEEILEIAKNDEKVAPAIEGKTIVKEIVVPGKIINIVIK